MRVKNGLFIRKKGVAAKLFSRKVLSIKKKRQQKLLKSRLLFKKIANITGKLLQNHA